MSVALDQIFEQLKTPQERMYVTLRLRGMSEFGAYRAAGGRDSPRGNQGGRVVEDFHNAPHVIAALDAAFHISQEETGYNRAKITEMLEAAYHNAANATEQVMAARELGKLHGLYAPIKAEIKHDHEHRLANAQKDLKELSVQELERMLAVDAEFTEITQPQLEHQRA
jgi:hypothetical protein